MGAEGLRDVEVLLETGKAVEDDRSGVRAGTGREVEDPEQIAAMAGEHHLLRGGGYGGGGVAAPV